MSMSTVIASCVRLARNYEDLPFNTARSPELAAMCIARTTNALTLAQADEGFDLLRLGDLKENERNSLEESELISRDLLKKVQTAAVLVRRQDGLTVMMNEEDHLCIQAVRPGEDLLTAASDCLRLDDALSRQVRFAYDPQLGYLTARPTSVGTGMHAALMVHLPMLRRNKLMGQVGKLVAEAGLTIRSRYGEGIGALGDVYQLTNQETLGRTEQEIISGVTAMGQQLHEMELDERADGMKKNRNMMEDMIFRAWGVLKYARRLSLEEFFGLWSSVRLGVSMGLLPVPLELVDAMLHQVQPAHLCAYAEAELVSEEIREARASRVRGMLKGY